MQPLLQIPVSVAGLWLAVAAVVASALWFADGLRSLRSRRAWRSSSPESLESDWLGLAEWHGRVELESPLFSPLSARPCAGFVLEVSGVHTRVGGAVSEARPFRLVCGGATARVEAEEVRWQLPVTAQRELAADAAMPERIRSLVESHAELRWLRAKGHALKLVERALLSGSSCHVMGARRTVRASLRRAVPVQLRTGTDAGVLELADIAESAPGSRIVADSTLEQLVISDRPIDREVLAPHTLRATGTVFGPLCGLGGLLYLAHAAESFLHARLG